MTKGLNGLCTILRAAGIIGIVFLFIHTEWRFVHGNLSNALNPLVQLFVVGSVFLLPLFWILFAVTVGCHFGRRMVRKRLSQAGAEE